MNAKWLSGQLRNTIRDNPSLRTTDIHNKITRKWKIVITKSMVWRVKGLTLSMLKVLLKINLIEYMITPMTSLYKIWDLPQRLKWKQMKGKHISWDFISLILSIVLSSSLFQEEKLLQILSTKWWKNCALGTLEIS